jgi:methylmalonyl-CoA mutase
MKRKDFSKLKIEVQKEKEHYFDHEDFIAGVAPFLRGIHSTMFLQTPLKITLLIESPIQENTTPEIELANFLTESFNHIQDCIQKNIAVDNAVLELTFQTTISKSHFEEIAKMRAARMLWAKMIKPFNPKNQDSLALSIHASVNNAVNASLAILGGCQSLASKEASHLFFKEETGVLKTVDPWAGSFYIEKKTEYIVNEAWLLFQKATNI